MATNWKYVLCIAVYLVSCLGISSSAPSTKAIVACNDAQPCPFDDLSGEEIKSVMTIVRNSGLFPADIRFPVIKMQEPKKADWLAGLAFDQRLAYAALFNLNTNILTEVTIDLRTQKIVEYTNLREGISPPIMFEEYEVAEEIVRSDPGFEAAVRKRGIEPQDTRLDIWGPGPLNETESGPGKRILRVIVNYMDPISSYFHWAVLEGLIITVDLGAGEVANIWDSEPVPMTPGIEETDFSNKPPLKPLEISQPEGSSIVVKGQRVEWYKWKFQYAVDPIYGLQLYHLRYDGDCEERSVIYKISLAEMFVPYGAKGQTWTFRNAFDAGEYGIGKLANTLEIGVDAPENSILLNCTVADDSGADPILIPGCVAIYEKDTGMLYKHTDFGTQKSSGVRGRVLMISMMTTVSNYDYTFDYLLHMDGTVQVQTRLTGILLARGVATAQNPEQCITDCISLVNDYLVGPTHQHFFNYRIDLDVDGQKNYVVESNVTPDQDDDPFTSAFSPKKGIISSETFRDYDFQADRSWHVINANSRNDYGSTRGYALKPSTIAYPYMTTANPFLQHALFVTHPIWFTKYKDEEQTCTDKFPRSGEPGQGLPIHIQNEEWIENDDVVVWYTFGVTHTTRAEEWPIMNVHNAGFTLLPYNFLSQNSEMPLKDRCQKRN